MPVSRMWLNSAESAGFNRIAVLMQAEGQMQEVRSTQLS